MNHPHLTKVWTNFIRFMLCFQEFSGFAISLHRGRTQRKTQQTATAGETLSL